MLFSNLPEVSEVFLKFHKFLGIFLLADKKISRVARLVLYETQINGIFAMSGLFSRNLTII